jgi:hypothetical protein
MLPDEKRPFWPPRNGGRLPIAAAAVGMTAIGIIYMVAERVSA